MQFQIDYQEIPKELAKLLNLKSTKNLMERARTAKIHINDGGYSLSFYQTNRYNFGRLNVHGALVLESHAF
jgi:hypothetical protein